MDIGDLRLPSGTHAAVLTGRDVLSGEQLAYPVVWANRPYDLCPTCGQSVANVIDECPVLLNTGAGAGGAVQEWSKQHGCGAWLAVAWREVTGDPARVDGDNIEITPRGHRSGPARRRPGAAQRPSRGDSRGPAPDCRPAPGRPCCCPRAAGRAAGNGESVEDRIAEVCTGSEVNPGVCWEDGELTAWDYGPVNDGDPIIVDANDLTGASRA